MSRKRPRIAVDTGIAGKLAEAGSALAVGVSIALVIAWYPSLPERIPTHFDGAMQPDAWGSRATILIGPIVGFAVWILLSFIQRIPHHFNYPTTITEDNAEPQYRFGVGLIQWIKLNVCAIGVLIPWSQRQAAHGAGGGLDAFLIWGLLITMFAGIGVYFVRALRAR